METEDRTRRAASWLVGLGLGLNLSGKVPEGWTNEDIMRLSQFLDVADSVHSGLGWSNPVQVWEMCDFAETLGFSKGIVSAIEANKKRLETQWRSNPIASG